MNIFNKHTLIHNLRSKLLLILLACTCLHESLAELHPSHLKYCPDGIRPAMTTEKLVNNVIVSFQKSFNHKDLGFNYTNWRCYFDSPNVIWTQYGRVRKPAKISQSKINDWDRFVLTTRVEGQLFSFEVFKSGDIKYKGLLKGKDESPADTNLVTTIRKYFPNLVSNVDDGALFRGKCLEDYSPRLVLPHNTTEIPRQDCARGKKLIAGKIHSGKLNLLYKKDLEDGGCLGRSIQNIDNCELAGYKNFFRLFITIDLKNDKPEKD